MRNKNIFVVFTAASIITLSASSAFSQNFTEGAKAAKKDPDAAIEFLKEGNKRYYSQESIHPHSNAARLYQAGTENQGNHAYATVITCSDSRVPVEHIFDAGIMDIFVIRVAGNVCDVDEVGSIEYGLAHVNTPVLVVLGHTQCGAVTAVTHAVQGRGHALERNIPPLVDNIKPAVKKAMAQHKDIHGDDIIPYAVEENVWQGIEDLFMKSPSSRNLVKEGKVKVIGAIYDVGTGKVRWLSEEKTRTILHKVESNPDRAMKAMAETGHAEHAPETHASSHSSKSDGRLVDQVATLINQFKEIDITITKSPEFYAEAIEDFRSENHTFADEPLGIQFKTIAILNKDFANGTDPEALIDGLPEEYR
jgi:carbonic anhydrase